MSDPILQMIGQSKWVNQNRSTFQSFDITSTDDTVIKGNFYINATTTATYPMVGQVATTPAQKGYYPVAWTVLWNNPVGQGPTVNATTSWSGYIYIVDQTPYMKVGWVYTPDYPQDTVDPAARIGRDIFMQQLR